MRSTYSALSLVLLFTPKVAFAEAPMTTVTFDDLPPLVNLSDPIPNGYAGLTWSNMFYYDGSYPLAEGSGYDNGRVSGDHVAFNAGGGVGLISTTLFDLNSAYFSAAWNEGLNITVRGFNGGAEVHNATFVVNPDVPTFVDFSWMGLDMVSLDSFGGIPAGGLLGFGTQFAMDDLTITLVPEPSSVTRLALAALALLMLRRCRAPMPASNVGVDD